MSMAFCKCGIVFPTQGDIVEHISLVNPNYPQVKEDDTHIQVTAQYWKIKFASYGIMCRMPNGCAGKGYCPLDPTCGD